MKEETMSLRKIAKVLGISPAYLSYMVNGKRPWRADLYERYTLVVNTQDRNVNKTAPYVSPLDPSPQLHSGIGGSGRESNPPTPCLTRHNGFEVRKSHRAPSTPNLGSTRALKTVSSARSRSSFSAYPWARHPQSGLQGYPGQI